MTTPQTFDIPAFFDQVHGFEPFLAQVRAFEAESGLTWQRSKDQVRFNENDEPFVFHTFSDERGGRFRGGFGGFRFDGEKIISGTFTPCPDNRLFAFFGEFFKCPNLFTASQFRVFPTTI